MDARRGKLSAHHSEIGLNFNSTDQLLALLVDVDILFECLLCIILFVFCAPRRAFMNF